MEPDTSVTGAVAFGLSNFTLSAMASTSRRLSRRRVLPAFSRLHGIGRNDLLCDGRRKMVGWLQATDDGRGRMLHRRVKRVRPRVHEANGVHDQADAAEVSGHEGRGWAHHLLSATTGPAP